MKALMVLSPISVVPTSVVVPVSRRPPVAPRPDPMVVAPSPTPSHPDVTRHRARRWDPYNRSRHWRRYDDWRRSDDNRGWNWDSEVDAETNPGVYRGDSNSGQGQNCDSLFHNVYRLDALGGHDMITNGLRFCKLRMDLLFASILMTSVGWLC
jgi:hypothetical protein